MRLKRPEKPAPEIPSHDEITAALIRDSQNPGPRYQNEPPAQPVEPPAEPSQGTVAEAANDEAAQDAPPASNPADTALRQQFEAMQQAQQMQRQQAAMASRIPRTPQELVALWKAQGLTDREAQFLLDHQEMIARPDFIARAANEAQAQGIERDSDEYFQTIADSFNRQVEERAQRKAKKAKKHAEPPPEFFTLPPAPPEQPEQSMSSIYSAPVSRQVGGGSVPTSPRSVTLTTAEREAARMSGISEMEYARNKILLMQRQARGEVQK
jgi:hypothetical protein